jgi:hypothetical protein
MFIYSYLLGKVTIIKVVSEYSKRLIILLLNKSRKTEVFIINNLSLAEKKIVDRKAA